MTYAVYPDPNFPDADGDGIPDNLPVPDEREEGTEHGDEDDGTAGTTGSAELAVSFEGLARACAGGLGDAVHAFTIQGTAKNAAGVAIPSAALTLLFENNRGEDKRAQFVPDIYHNQALVPDTDSEEMTVATDENGHFDLTVRSSDTISNNIKVKVTWKNANGETENVGEQAYPTYELFVNGEHKATDPQAPNPIGHFYYSPYPFGRATTTGQFGSVPAGRDGQAMGATGKAHSTARVAPIEGGMQGVAR